MSWEILRLRNTQEVDSGCRYDGDGDGGGGGEPFEDSEMTIWDSTILSVVTFIGPSLLQFSSFQGSGLNDDDNESVEKTRSGVAL